MGRSAAGDFRLLPQRALGKEMVHTPLVSQCVGSGCGLVRARLLPIALTAPGADQEGLVGVPVIFAEFLACDTHCAFGQHRARLDTTRTAVDVGQVGQHWAKHPVAADLGHRERFLQQAARFIRVALREARQRQAGQRVGQVVKVLAAVRARDQASRAASASPLEYAAEPQEVSAQIESGCISPNTGITTSTACLNASWEAEKSPA